MESVTESVNEKHLGPWAEIVRANGITVTPLSPYLDLEILDSHSLSVDGTKIERETGFKYNVPLVTKEKLIEIIDEFKAIDVWPKQDLD